MEYLNETLVGMKLNGISLCEKLRWQGPYRLQPPVDGLRSIFIRMLSVLAVDGGGIAGIKTFLRFHLRLIFLMRAARTMPKFSRTNLRSLETGRIIL